jgi:hypothetical protein
MTRRRHRARVGDTDGRGPGVVAARHETVWTPNPYAT